MEFVKKFYLVPLAMIGAGIYVFYNKKNLVHRLVDPGDGSPEVMEISEEPAYLNDYFIAMGATGSLVAIAIYLSDKSGSGSVDSLQTKSRFDPILGASKISPKSSFYDQPKVSDSIMTGPANF